MNSVLLFLCFIIQPAMLRKCTNQPNQPQIQVVNMSASSACIICLYVVSLSHHYILYTEKLVSWTAANGICCTNVPV